MKYSYIHKAAGNYLIIAGKSAINDDDYRIMMLKKNKLKRFLELKVNYVDNEANYYYKISSRQSLKSMFDSKKLKYEEILTIVSGLKEAANELEMYLLNPDNIILNPDNIYVNPTTKEPEFCFNPECDVGIVEGIRELFRYFLNIIDNSDKRTVEYAYDIYCSAMRDDFSLDNLSEGIELKEMTYAEFQSEVQCIEEDDTEQEVVKKDRNKPLVFGIKQFICKVLKISNKDEMKLYKEDLQKGVVFFKEEEEEKTELLDISMENYRLISIDGESIIEISEFPYVIGKLPNQVNKVINSDKVSRLHAKIIMDENKIYIMDMNSKNGTYINGMRILLYERKELKSGDKVRFADREYIYQQVH